MAYESFAPIRRKNLVKETLPEFVVNDHQTFVAFLEAYYEFLSETQFVTSEKFIDYLDVDSVPQEFLDYFWDELKEIPNSVIVDKRLLASHIRDLYAAKGTRRSLNLLFRILFDESIEIYEPKDDILRPSDGKWTQKTLIRTMVPKTFDLTSLNGKKLFQFNDFNIELCQFIVSDVSIVGSTDSFLILEIIPSSLVGSVFPDQRLFNLDRSISLEIVPTFVVKDYPHRGSNYRSGDIFTSGDITLFVESVGSGSVDSIAIVDGGSGYSVGQFIEVDDSGAGGAGLVLKVSAVNLSGSVTSVKIINAGYGYEDLPKIVGNGTGNFIAISDSIGRILRLEAKNANEKNLPINYRTRAIVNETSSLIEGELVYKAFDKVRLESEMGLLLEDGDRIVSETSETSIEPVGRIFEIENQNTIIINDNFGEGVFLLENNNLMKMEDGDLFLSETSTLELDDATYITENGTFFDIIHVNQARINSGLSPIYVESRKFKNEDGFVSQGNKRIHDSLFYQDFSYVIRSAQSFDTYKNVIYKLFHPAGMEVFGEVKIDSFVRKIFDRLNRSFSEVRLFSEKVLSIKYEHDRDLKFVIESKSTLGETPEFLERYKFILGENYASGSYGAAVDIGTKHFNRTEYAADKSWKIADIGHLKFTDIYDYDPAYTQEFPLLLDGSFNLDGSEILDGKVSTNLSIPASYGRYKLRTDKRFQFTNGVEIIVMPSFPIEDTSDVDDFTAMNFQPIVEDSLNVVDEVSFVISQNRIASDEVISDDLVTSELTFGRFASETITVSDDVTFVYGLSVNSTANAEDSVSSFGLDSPKDIAEATDSISWTLSSGNTGINNSPINTGEI